MKWVFRLLLCLVGAAALSACAPATSVSPTMLSAAGDAAEASYEGLHPPQDLSLVAATGRPQFIVSYADW